MAGQCALSVESDVEGGGCKCAEGGAKAQPPKQLFAGGGLWEVSDGIEAGGINLKSAVPPYLYAAKMISTSSSPSSRDTANFDGLSKIPFL